MNDISENEVFCLSSGSQNGYDLRNTWEKRGERTESGIKKRRYIKGQTFPAQCLSVPPGSSQSRSLPVYGGFPDDSS